MERTMDDAVLSLGVPAQRGGRLAALGVALLALGVMGSWIGGQHPFEIPSEHAQVFDAMVWAALLSYVLAMALPFVPGIEIGLVLMMVLGDEGIVLVYAATQVALLLSFTLGRWVPVHWAGAAFRWLGLERAARLLQAMESIPPTERAAVFARRLPGRWGEALARHYGVAVALLLNLPGNAVIGGAGGIGFIAGMSRAIPPVRYLVLVAVATTPVPLFLLLRGAA
jgi:hypothetical protein